LLGGPIETGADAGVLGFGWAVDGFVCGWVDMVVLLLFKRRFGVLGRADLPLRTAAAGPWGR
jgi:hypothetical protein